MKKHLNTDVIANELRELSPFFQRAATDLDAAPRPAQHPAHRSGADVSEPNPQESMPPKPASRDRSIPRTERASRTPRPSRTPVIPLRRTMIRHPFDIYQDQLEQLRREALEDRLRGGIGSMSLMVREALDRLLTERKTSDRE